MEYIAGLGLNELLMLGLGILIVGFVLKKLFKLAIILAFIIFLVYYGLPMLQTMMPA